MKVCRPIEWAAWAALAALSPAPLAAQAGEPRPPWSATLHYDVQRIAPGPDAAYWHTLTAGAGRKVPGGSLALHAVASRRFDIDDHALVAEAYHALWRGAYGNLRAGLAPGAETMARYDLGAEVFQAIGSSELSGSVRRQGFELTEVSTFGAGLGHYVGSWYLRPRTVIARVDASWSPFVSFTGRRYLGDGTDNSFDLTVGMGEEVLEVEAPAGAEGRVGVVTSGSRFASVRAQRYFGPHLGATAGASYSAYETIADRWGVSVGLLTRW